MFGIILSFFLTILIPTTLWFHFFIGITIVIATLLILSGKQLLKRPWFTSGHLLKKLWFSLSGKQLLKRPWFTGKQLLNGLWTRCVQIAPQRWVTVYVFFSTFILVSAYMLIGILTIIGLIGVDKELRKDATHALIVPLLLVFLNNILIVTKKSFTILWQIIAIFFLIFLYLNVWTFIPRRIISIYKFGNIENASVVLNEIGCAIAKNHGLKVKPYTPDPKIVTTSDPKSCSLSNVIIHSRLGNTYYLETSRSNDTAIHFTISGQNVLSWAVDESKKATTAGSPASTQNPAPTTEIAPPNKGMEPTR